MTGEQVERATVMEALNEARLAFTRRGLAPPVRIVVDRKAYERFAREAERLGGVVRPAEDGRALETIGMVIAPDGRE